MTRFVTIRLAEVSFAAQAEHDPLTARKVVGDHVLPGVPHEPSHLAQEAARLVGIRLLSAESPLLFASVHWPEVLALVRDLSRFELRCSRTGKGSGIRPKCCPRRLRVRSSSATSVISADSPSLARREDSGHHEVQKSLHAFQVLPPRGISGCCLSCRWSAE